MNPQSNETSASFNLPEIHQDQVQPQSAEQLRTVSNEKQTVIATEQGKGAPAPQGFSQVTGLPPDDPTQVSASPPPMPVGSAGLPQIADDIDLIEKEWVDKAKEIVAQTAHDPYLQNQEMTKVKADYLKKRYNKDIKLSD